jgi:hypothetical protein
VPSRDIDVSPESRPACLCVSETFRVALDPLQHVEEASRPFVIPFGDGLVAQIPDLVQVRCLHVILSGSSDHGRLDSLFSISLGQMRSRFVKKEAAADLDILVLSQLHLVEEVERELGRLFLIRFLSEAWALKEEDRDHIVVKLSGLFAVCSNDDSVQEIADTGVVYLDSQSLGLMMPLLGDKRDLPGFALLRHK